MLPLTRDAIAKRQAALRKERSERVIRTPVRKDLQRRVTVLPPAIYRTEAEKKRRAPNSEWALHLSHEVYPRVAEDLVGAHVATGHQYAENATTTHDPTRDAVVGIVRHAWVTPRGSVDAVIELDDRTAAGRQCARYMASANAHESGLVKEVSLGSTLYPHLNEVEVIELSLCRKGRREGTVVHPLPLPQQQKQ